MECEEEEVEEAEEEETEEEKMARRERARRHWIEEATRLCPELEGQDDDILEWLGRSTFCLCGEYLGERRRWAIPVVLLKETTRRHPNVAWVCERHLDEMLLLGGCEPLLEEDRF
jgi:hypothetical protein